MKNDPKRLGQELATYLKDLRRRRGLTQYDVCSQSGIAHTTYRRYERNDDDVNAGISLDTLCALSKLEDLSLGDFVHKLEGEIAGDDNANRPAWEAEIVDLFGDVPASDRDEFIAALRGFNADKVIPNPLTWLLRMGVVLLRADRRFQLRVERDVLDQGINSEGMTPEKTEEMVKRIEHIIRESFRRKS